MMDSRDEISLTDLLSPEQQALSLSYLDWPFRACPLMGTQAPREGAPSAPLSAQ